MYATLKWLIPRTFVLVGLLHMQTKIKSFKILSAIIREFCSISRELLDKK